MKDHSYIEILTMNLRHLIYKKNTISIKYLLLESQDRLYTYLHLINVSNRLHRSFLFELKVVGN